MQSKENNISNIGLKFTKQTHLSFNQQVFLH